jgi:ABC-type multidrug transport system permease subunit
VKRERGTLEQLLVSPMSRWGLMPGKLLPYLVIFAIMAAAGLLAMRWLFQVPVAGSGAALSAATLVYIFTLLSLGLLISTRAQNQMQALQMTMVFMMPSVFFCGFTFPRDTMPWIFSALGSVLPATCFIELMRAIVLRGDAGGVLVESGGAGRHGCCFVRAVRPAVQGEDRVRRRPDSPAAGTGLHIDLCCPGKRGNYQAVRRGPGPA